MTYITSYYSNTHTQVEVGSPDEVEEIFDAISYCKGASIIRMLHDWIGDQVDVCVCACACVCGVPTLHHFVEGH